MSDIFIFLASVQLILSGMAISPWYGLASAGVCALLAIATKKQEKSK